MSCLSNPSVVPAVRSFAGHKCIFEGGKKPREGDRGSSGRNDGISHAHQKEMCFLVQ